LPPGRNVLREHLKRVIYQVEIWKRAHITKPAYSEPTHDHGWQCVDKMIEPKWVSEHEKWIISYFQNFYRIFLIGQVKLLYGNFCPINIVLSEC
jgi:hypothetical protein